MSEDLSGLNLIELLDLLQVPPEPEPVSLFPATVGWIWSGLALAVLCGWAIYRWRARYRANAYRRAALAELA